MQIIAEKIIEENIYGQSIRDSGKSLTEYCDRNYAYSDIKKYGKYYQKRKTPSNYSILSCITKYDPQSFDDFCNELGYNNDSIKDFNLYRSICEEWNNIRKFFNTEEIELLREIN